MLITAISQVNPYPYLKQENEDQARRRREREAKSKQHIRVGNAFSLTLAEFENLKNFCYNIYSLNGNTRFDSL